MRGLVSWFIDNPIAANLLMLLIFVGGISSFPNVDKRFFPDRVLNRIQISVVYPGASPSQVQEQLVVRIEEAIDELEGIDQIDSTASEGLATVTVVALANYDSQRLLNDIKARVEALPTLPADAERPLIKELLFKSRVISVALAGNIGEANLKELGRKLRAELAAHPAIQSVELRSPRDYELSIEIPEMAMRQYALDFTQISNAIRAASLNVSAGRIRSDNGDIQIQALGQGYSADDYRNVVLVSNPDGSRITLGDLAEIRDGFVEDEVVSEFNGRQSLSLEVFVSGKSDILKTSNAVEAFVEEWRPRLPPGMELATWRDMSVEFKGRLATLINNGFGGLVVIFVILLLFLRPLLAFWVCAGIAVALIGAIWLLPLPGISLNMVSLFAFILILGIVVDDAIIVGESIYSSQSGGKVGIEAARDGTFQVLKPVCIAVLTTMIFFLPFLALPPDQPEPYNLGWVVLLALSFSLVESMLILPSHLAHMPPERPGRYKALAGIEWARAQTARGLAWLIDSFYRPLVLQAIAWRGVTIALFFVALTSTVAIFAGGWMQFSFFPTVPMGEVSFNYTIKPGVTFDSKRDLMDRARQSAVQAKQHYNAGDTDYVGHIETTTYADSVSVSMEMLNAEHRPFSTDELEQRVRAGIGDESIVKNYSFKDSIFDPGKDIELRVSADSVETLRNLSADIRRELATFPGVFDIQDQLDNALPELQVELKPEADRLGIRLQDVIRHLRHGVYGDEVQRIPRGEEDVKVMLRYPKQERSSVNELLKIRLRTSDGAEVTLHDVAQLKQTTALKRIDRIDGRVATVVGANLRPGHSAEDVLSTLFANRVPEWLKQHRGSRIALEGEQEEQAEFVGTLMQLTGLAMLVIYALFAVVFRSYWQPVLVMSAIPFGLMGAIIGHLLFGREISMFSILGVVAVAGVVVNDNLVMLDRINRYKEQGMAVKDAIVRGACDRFRPILLTSVTTFSGLTPIMMESSIQAQFLIPMVLSLAFGVLLATLVTLLFVPALTSLGHDIAESVATAIKRGRNALSPG